MGRYNNIPLFTPGAQTTFYMLPEAQREDTMIKAVDNPQNLQRLRQVIARLNQESLAGVPEITTAGPDYVVVRLRGMPSVSTIPLSGLALLRTQLGSDNETWLLEQLLSTAVMAEQCGVELQYSTSGFLVNLDQQRLVALDWSHARVHQEGLTPAILANQVIALAKMFLDVFATIVSTTVRMVINTALNGGFATPAAMRAALAA